FNPLGDNTQTLSGFVEKILKGVIKIGMPIIVLAIIYSGFLFVSAQGNSEKLSEAKRALLYTLIGAAILLGSWAIALLIRDTVLAL
ncbi:MAG: TrbC/VirB2 family protein, partial [Bacteroidales bacterium]